MTADPEIKLATAIFVRKILDVMRARLADSPPSPEFVKTATTVVKSLRVLADQIDALVAGTKAR